jgi:hypothetical protein
MIDNDVAFKNSVACLKAMELCQEEIDRCADGSPPRHMQEFYIKTLDVLKQYHEQSGDINPRRVSFEFNASGNLMEDVVAITEVVNNAARILQVASTHVENFCAPFVPHK